VRASVGSLPARARFTGMHCLARPAPLSTTRPLRGAFGWMLACAVALAFATGAWADVQVKEAQLAVDEGELILSAEFEISLTPALEEALQKGIPLYFVQEFELIRIRRFWIDEKVLDWSTTYRVSYNAITQQYRVASGPLGQAFDSLDDVLRFIGRIANRRVGRADALTPGARYEGAVRLRLDVNQLPKPFQLNALASREWQLASDWYRFPFTP
jgi:hypothetical protein